MTRTARWEIHTETDERGVSVSRKWTAADSDYYVKRELTGAGVNTFIVYDSGDDEISAHGMLSDAINDIERIESLYVPFGPGDEPLSANPWDTERNRAIVADWSDDVIVQWRDLSTDQDQRAFLLAVLERRHA